jgi:hypothetical protein
MSTAGGRLTEEPHQHHLFFQGLEHFTQPLAEVVRGQVRGSTKDDLLLVSLDQAGQQHRQHGVGVDALAGRDLLGQVGDHGGGVGQLMPAQAGVHHRPDMGHGGVVPGLGQVDGALLHPPGVGDEHEQHSLRGERDQLDVPDGGPGQRRVLHHGYLAGELDQEPDGPRDHVVEAVRPRQERLDRTPLGA